MGRWSPLSNHATLWSNLQDCKIPSRAEIPKLDRVWQYFPDNNAYHPHTNLCNLLINLWIWNRYCVLFIVWSSFFTLVGLVGSVNILSLTLLLFIFQWSEKLGTKKVEKRQKISWEVLIGLVVSLFQANWEWKHWILHIFMTAFDGQNDDFKGRSYQSYSLLCKPKVDILQYAYL